MWQARAQSLCGKQGRSHFDDEGARERVWVRQCSCKCCFSGTDDDGKHPTGENLAVFGPTAIATRAIKREAEPIDVAKAIYFLVSPDADFVTGQILAADGGSVYH